MFITENTSVRETDGWATREVTWDDLRNRFAEPTISQSKDVKPYILGSFAGGKRRMANLISRSAVTFDVDVRGKTFFKTLSGSGIKCLWHTTFSSTNEKPKYRVVFPVTRDMKPEEYSAVCLHLAKRLGASVIDPASFKPNQVMFSPACKDRSVYRSGEFEGEVVDVDAALKEYEALAGESKPAFRPRETPFDKKYPIGEFNAVYQNFDELIATFDLPYERVGDRWRLLDAKGQPGVIEYEPGVWFSWHQADPLSVGGHCFSAFDAVRVHKFGALDDEAVPGTPSAKLPSYVKMVELASKDQAVVKARVEGLLSPVDPSGPVAPQPPTPSSSPGSTISDDDWRLKMERDTAGVATNSSHNLMLLVRNDPDLTRLFFDQFGSQVRITPSDDDAPLNERLQLSWDGYPREQQELMSHDRAMLFTQMNLRYGMRLKKDDANTLIDLCAAVRRTSSIQRFMNSLVWDGVPRVDTCLPVAAHTEYTRMAARTAILGTAARAIDPGCQFDHTLVLYGPQGIGKTTWVRRMAVSPDWLGTLPQLDGHGLKDAREIMVNSWIVVADEMYAASVRDFDRTKAFLTDTQDQYRGAYRSDPQRHKRYSVVWGTTNNKRFLHKRPGNRRFLPVEAARWDLDAVTPEYVEQVWAEAVHRVRNGERYHLTDEEAELLEEVQREFTIDFGLPGQIEAYLAMRVPERWNSKDNPMSKQERYAWFSGERDGFFEEERALTTPSTVCALDIVNAIYAPRVSPSQLRSYIIEIVEELNASEMLVPSPVPVEVPLFGKQDVWFPCNGVGDLL